MIDVIYDSFNMQTNNVTVSDISGVYGAPSRNVQVENIAGRDGGVLGDSKYNPRTITISGQLTANTQLELETLITQFNRALNKEEKELKIEDEGDYIVYTATPSVVQVERPRGLTKANFNVDFVCANPVGLVQGIIILANDTYTTASDSTAITVEGSYKAEPVISVVVNSFTGTGDRSVIIRNGKNFAGITVTRTWTAGDELEIDCKNLTVTVNGATTDFVGLFPSWQAGNGIISYVDTFTARDVDITVTYNKRKV